MSAVTADPIAACIPIYVTQAGRRTQFGAGVTCAYIANFVVDPARPDLLSIGCRSFSLDLDRAGVKRGMSEPWTDPDGQVTVALQVSGDVRWLVIDLDVPSLPIAQVSFQLDRVADFLAMADALLDLTSIQFADEIAAWMGAGLDSTQPEVTG